MRQATSRQGKATAQQGQTAAAEGQPAEPVAVDQERLVWDPEYRREIARLLRQLPPEGS
ncbi:MAG: hypothetical protein ACFCUQ_12930 [Kiloniellales bacterium]